MNHAAHTTILVLVLVQSSSAQNSSHCTIDQQRGFPEGYQDRTDRCEGLYRQKVSGTPLSFTGFSVGLSADLQWDKVARLDLSWPAPADKPVRLQVLSLLPTVPYRMDSLRLPSSGGTFQWPTQILARVGLCAGELALAAWHDADSVETSRIYLPIRVEGRPSAPLETTLY